MLHIAYVESFWGGSHRAVAEGWARRSRHEIRFYTLPARFWKWRMRGAALALARTLAPELDRTDLLWVTDLVDLAHLRALLPRPVPAVLYFHENQAAYPWRGGEEPAERDLQYAFTNLASALAADRVLFNSAFQRDAFFREMERLVRRMPDARPLWALDRIRERAAVLHPGVELADIPPRAAPDGGPPVVLWNHRWEHDKAPEVFFAVLERLASRGVAFRVAVAGESFSRVPRAFERARGALEGRILHWGFVPERRRYAELLARCDVAVSTARQENFGLSVVEAAFAGAHPLVPDRLAYPEVLPAPWHAACLYADEADLERRLEGLLTGRVERLPAPVLRDGVSRYAWERRASAFDAEAEAVIGAAGSGCRGFVL